jgi:hypothetical protein
LFRWDFAQNYIHERAEMVQSEHFGKEQTQMLIAVVWFHDAKSIQTRREIQKKYYVFTSSYLTHSSLLFQKCYNTFIHHIQQYLSHPITKEILLSDGSSQQFKNKNNFYWASQQSADRGNFSC